MTLASSHWQLFGLLLGFVLLSTTGCQSRNTPDLGYVSGKVTLDGEPLADARVTFEPVGEGSPSTAKTDENGDYTLIYSVDIEGALIGQHQVRITTYREEYNEGSLPTEIPERVPPQYNSATTEVREVTAGSQTHNFDLVGALN